jgi:hypothetical protein
MSDGMFVVPITTDTGLVLGWGRDGYIVHGAAYHKERGTDLRFLRVVNGEVVELNQEETDAILAQDAAALQADADAAAAAAANADAAAAADADAAAAHQARLQGLRDAYASATAQLCQLAGLEPVRCLTLEQVELAVMPLLTGPNQGIVNGLSTLLTNLEVKLRAEDGKNALDRV